MREKDLRPFVCDEADRRLIIPVYLLGLLFTALFVPFRLGVNVPIFVLCVYIAAFRYQIQADVPTDRGSTTLLLIVMIATLPFVLYDASPFRILHFAVLMAAVLFQLYTMFSCRAYPRLSENWLYDLGNAVFLTPLANLDAFWRVLVQRFGQGRFRSILTVVGGILVALPLLFLLGTQLLSADAAFELMYAHITVPFWHYFQRLLLGLAAAVPIAMFFFGALYGFRYRRLANILTKPDEERIHIIPSEAVIAALVPICMLQAVYLASQIVYFFSTLSGFLPDNFTYAEYARRGFLELCAASLINLTVIAAVLAFTKHKKRGTDRAVHALVIFLCVCSLVMIATAFTKMILYMRSFGLTANRIITSWFMLGLALVFLYTIIRCLRPSFKLVRTVTVTAIAMFLALCFVDCDYLAVAYNKEAYLSGRLEGFDIELLQNSSDSVIPLAIDLYEQADGQLKADALALLQRYEARDDSVFSWRSFNITRYNARSRFQAWQEAAEPGSAPVS